MLGALFGGVFATITIVIIATIYLPAAVWNAETGRYHGYFKAKALLTLLVVAVMGGALSTAQGKPGPDVVADVGFYLFIVIAASRIYVEWAHHYKHKAWLRHLYHKMTE